MTPKYLKIWLSMQEAYTSLHPVNRVFKHPRVLEFSLNYQWDTNTANILKCKDHSDGFSYFVVFIDIFQDFSYTYPLKTLSGSEMTNIFKRLITEQEVIPKQNEE